MRPVRGSDVHPLKWAFEQGKELGFDGLELCMRGDRNCFVTMMRPEWRSGIAELASEYDLPILSLSSDWAWSYAVFNPTYKEWGKGVGFLAKDAELAQELGADTILVHFGTSQGPWEDGRALLKDVAAAGEQMVEGIFVMIDKLLPLEHQRVVATDCPNGSLQCRTARAGLLPASVLLDEIPGGKFGHLIRPLYDTITILDLHAFVGVQVQDEPFRRDLYLRRGGHRE